MNLNDVTILIVGPGVSKEATINALNQSDKLKDAAETLGISAFVKDGLIGVSDTGADVAQIASAVRSNPQALEVLRTVRDGLNKAIDAAA